MESDIKDLSLKCDEAFRKLSEIYDGQGRSHAVVEALHQQFKQWTRDLSVYAKPHLSLDASLQYSESLRDLVTHILQLIAKNLQRIDEVENESQDNDREIHEPSSVILAQMNQWSGDELSSLFVESLKALESSVDSLRRLGSAIQQSSASTLTQRMNDFVKKKNDGVLEDMLYLHLRHRLVARAQEQDSTQGAALSLCRQLATSISFRYFSVLYIRSHHAKKRDDKENKGKVISVRSHKQPASEPMLEDPIHEARLPLATKEKSLLQATHLIDDAPQSDTIPSVPNSKIAREIYLTASKSFFPAESIISMFARFEQWKHHMDSVHSRQWICEVHPPLKWYCNMGHDEEHFKDEEAFEQHVESKHPEYSEGLALDGLKDWCSLKLPRPAYTCPVCNSIPEKVAKVLNVDNEGVPSLDFSEDTRTELLRHIAQHLKQVGLMSVDYLQDGDGTVSLLSAEQSQRGLPDGAWIDGEWKPPVGPYLDDDFKYYNPDHEIVDGQITEEWSWISDRQSDVISDWTNGIGLPEHLVYDDSEYTIRERLALTTGLGGPDHQHRIHCFCALAIVSAVSEQFSEAEKASRDALELSTRVLGADNPITISLIERLKAVLTSMNKQGIWEHVWQSSSSEEALKLHGDTIKKAITDFMHGLQRRAVSDFRIMTLDHLKTFLADFQARLHVQRRLQDLVRLQPFLEAIEQYEKVISTFYRSNDVVACVWGPLKFLLQTSSAHDNALFEVLTLYEQIGETLPLVSQHQQQFRAEPHMIQILVLIYKDILEFQRIMLRFFQQPLWQRVFSESWTTYKFRLSSILLSLAQYRSLIESQAIPAQIEETRESIQQARQAKNDEVEEQNERLLGVIRNWLKPADVEVDQAKFVDERANYPGTGKSMLASLIVQTAEELKHTPTVLYFYCKHENPERNNFVALGRSLLAQLLHHDNELLPTFYQKYCRSGEAIPSSSVLLQELLTLAFENCKSAYIILDGLDECPRDQRRYIANWFRDLVENLPSWQADKLRCLFISQDDGPARKDFAGLVSIRIRAEDTQHDIKEFCRIQAGKLLENNPSLSDEKVDWIATTVANSVNGLFLLARLVWANLSSHTSLKRLEEELNPNVFPKEINEAFLLDEGYVVPSNEELNLAILSIDYLNLPAFVEPPTRLGVLNGDYGFMDYAVLFWLRHLNIGVTLEDGRQELMDQLAESLESFIENHWNSPTVRLRLANRHSDKLQHFKPLPFYDRLEQAVASTNQQLRSFGISKMEENALDLARMVCDVRKLLEHIISNDLEHTDQQMVEKRYGTNLFKCPQFSCQFFTLGFSTAAERDKHIVKHERPFPCSDEMCVRYTFGFSSAAEREKHIRENHFKIAIHDDEFPTQEDIDRSISRSHFAAEGNPTRNALKRDNSIGDATTAVPEEVASEPESEVEPRYQGHLKRVRQTEFKCPHCNNVYKRRYNLQSHILSHQFERSSPNPGPARTDTPTSLPSLKRPYPFNPDEQRLVRNLPSNALLHDRNSGITSSIEVKCFGSIIDVKVYPHNIVVLGHSNTWSKGPVQSFAVIREGDFLTLRHGQQKFGRLNKGLCRHLLDLVANQQLRFQVFIANKDLSAAMRSLNGQPPDHLPAEINIYGPEADAREIGEILSKTGIFLQLPRYGTSSVGYHNPQMMQLEVHSDLLSPEVSRADSTNDTPETFDRHIEGSITGNDTAVVDSLLDSLSHHPYVQEIATVPDIRSNLFMHQKEAVDFMSRREREHRDSESSLWEYNDMDADEPFYQHVLSGAKQPEPTETRGGILADEMGLGKSLVIIYAVASSLDRAAAFVAAEDKQRISQPERKRASKATLIIAPSSLLIDNWVDEIDKHTVNGALPIHRHIGISRHNETRYLHERPIVFTTYATVAAEFRRGNSTLARVNWFRIVLDEAHGIRNRTTKQFQAVADIPALHRWCLTGTPIQNKLEDLGALISFLKVPILEKAPTFRKFITNPIESGSRNRFKNLHTLLRTVCLRRTRQSCLDLPVPISKEQRLVLAPSEYSDYQGLLVQGRLEYDMAVSRRGHSNVNSAFLEALLRLRLFCNNGRANASMQSGPSGLPTDPDEALIYLQQHGQDTCAYCSATIYFINEDPGNDGGLFISGCSHLLCHNCVPIHRAEKKGCPSCISNPGSALQTALPSTDMHMDLDQWDTNDDFNRTVVYPSKLMALLSDIQRDSQHKSIIFSSWKKTLTIVSKLFTTHGIRHEIIDGSLSLTKRIDVLKNFRSASGVNTLLMTLGTGAVGQVSTLNLAVATRIYLLEPQWNPSIESQAIGRVLRLGQTDQVVIIRYIMKDTIEESNVLFRQKRKLELAGGGFNQSDRIQELQNIFGIDANPASD
ncbi:hypothetical protein E8E14_002949 [Neopestalotiopsis sp. 37M]|nr:hypothetical protein E8E14_002949 [Neopestalotiopsis sp. 37M]